MKLLSYKKADCEITSTVTEDVGHIARGWGIKEISHVHRWISLAEEWNAWRRRTVSAKEKETPWFMTPELRKPSFNRRTASHKTQGVLVVRQTNDTHVFIDWNSSPKLASTNIPSLSRSSTEQSTRRSGMWTFSLRVHLSTETTVDPSFSLLEKQTVKVTSLPLPLSLSRSRKLCVSVPAGNEMPVSPFFTPSTKAACQHLTLVTVRPSGNREWRHRSEPSVNTLGHEARQ